MVTVIDEEIYFMIFYVTFCMWVVKWAAKLAGVDLIKSNIFPLNIRLHLGPFSAHNFVSDRQLSYKKLRKRYMGYVLTQFVKILFKRIKQHKRKRNTFN